MGQIADDRSLSFGEHVESLQRRVLEVIRNAIRDRGYPPSMREIGEKAGLASPSSVAHQLRVLETHGYIRRDPNRPRALEILDTSPPDVFNHNLETVPSLYRKVRPGSDYAWSLNLLKRFKARHPDVPTKSGLMLGVGETIEEVEQVMRDLRTHDCDMLTLGQYLQPSKHHLPLVRYVHPDEFDRLGELGYELGFTHVASGPMVRSSYHADQQAKDVVGHGR